MANMQVAIDIGTYLIVHKNYKNQNLAKNESIQILDYIQDKAESFTERAIRFREKVEPEGLYLTFSDEESKEFIVSAIRQKFGGNQSNIVIKPQAEYPRYYYSGKSREDLMSETDAILILQRQNREFNFRRWKLIEKGKFHCIYEVDPSSAFEMGDKMTFNFNSGTIDFEKDQRM